MRLHLKNLSPEIHAMITQDKAEHKHPNLEQTIECLVKRAQRLFNPGICFFCGVKVEDSSDTIGKIPVCTYCLSEMDWKGKQATERIDKGSG